MNTRRREAPVGRALSRCAWARRRAPGARAAEDGFVSLFDGKSLAGWKASENPASFRVVDGAIACDGPRAHLFYVGPDGQAAFENFEAVAEVKARAGANSGFYFHTAFQEKDWPAQGFEVQVNNSQKRHGDYLELKMTGSLYGIRNVYKALAQRRRVVHAPRHRAQAEGRDPRRTTRSSSTGPSRGRRCRRARRS